MGRIKGYCKERKEISMKKEWKLWKESYLELKNIRTITTCAMFGAISIVLGYFTIQIGDFLKIGFSNIPNQIVAYLFGPVLAPIFGGAMDIVKYLIKPVGGFFPGFTITAILAGMINGCFLYRKKITWKRAFIVNFIIMFFCDIVLNTYWLSLLYGKGFLALLPLRGIKNLIMWPVNSFLMYSVIKFLEITGIFQVLEKQKTIERTES